MSYTDLQDAINMYLKDKGKKTVGEMLSEFGKVEETGVITNHHLNALQQILLEYGREHGIDLNEELLKKEGRKQVLGVISRTELDYAQEFVNNYKIDKRVR